MSEKKSMIHDLTEGSIFKLLLRFSIPFMLSNLLNTIYTLVDLAVIGNFTDSVSVSAISIAGSYTMLFCGTGMMVGSGGGIFIAQLVGAKRFADLRETIGTLTSFCVLMSVVLSVAGYIFTVPLLNIMNTPAECMDVATRYLRICMFGIPFTFLYGTLSDTLRGMGDSKHPLYIIAASAVINTVLDLIFVAVFHWGAAGAAAATSIAQVFSCVYCIIFLYRRKEQFHFDFRANSFIIRGDKLKVMLKLSMPLVLMNLAVSISMMYLAALVNNYGVVYAAVTGIGFKVSNIMTIVNSAMNSSVSSMVGQNVGAGKKDRARKVVYVSWILCIASLVITVFLCYGVPEWLFGIFSNDPEVLAISRRYMAIAFFSYVSYALMSPPLGFINGIGFTSLNMIISLLDGVAARIVLCIILGNTMGVEGLWWSNSLASYVSVICAFVYFFFGNWRGRADMLRNVKHSEVAEIC